MISDHEAKQIEKKGSGWTVEETLEKVLHDIKSGAVKPNNIIVCIEHETTDEEDGPIVPIRYCSAMGHGEHVAALQLQLTLATKEWMGPMWAGQP